MKKYILILSAFTFVTGLFGGNTASNKEGETQISDEFIQIIEEAPVIRNIPGLPKVLVHLIDMDDRLAPGHDTWVEVVYRAKPGGAILQEEFAEKIWWIQDSAMLIFGSSGEPLSSAVLRRATVYVELFLDGEPLNHQDIELHPQKNQMTIDNNASSIKKALVTATSFDALYLVQVANYLAGNLASIDVTATSYSIDTYGEVIDSSGVWVGVSGPGATDINGLSDAKTSLSSVFLGNGAGMNDDGTENQNTAVGENALSSNISGSGNTASGYLSLSLNNSGINNAGFGFGALQSNTIGEGNTAVGFDALQLTSEGTYNCAIGSDSMQNTIAGHLNAAVGSSSLRAMQTGNHNVAIGSLVGRFIQEGHRNTLVGYNSGSGETLHTKSGNIFLGYESGFYETGSEKLYIENSNSTSPLIFGDFASDHVAVNGHLSVGTMVSLPTAALHVQGGGMVVLGVTGQPIPYTGWGALMMYHSGKSAFRVGAALDSWVDNKIGVESFATGHETEASGYASFASGMETDATGHLSFTTGLSTLASGSQSFATGRYTNAIGNNSCSMGDTSTASGENSTSIGQNSSALGTNTTAMGYQTIGNAYASLTIGRYNIDDRLSSMTSWVASDPVFVIGNGTGTGAASNNALLVRKDGLLKSWRNINGNGNIADDYVANIANTFDVESGGDVLALRVSVDNPAEWSNYIGFFDSNSLVGEIDGNGLGGVTYKSAAMDFAEWLPKVAHEEMNPGDIVGLINGKLTKQTGNSDQIMVITTAPLVVGNSRSENRRDSFACAAFMGQVPVRVKGIVQAGDCILPSGDADGLSIAIHPDQLKLSQLNKVAGLALESSDEPGTHSIHIMVGVHSQRQTAITLKAVVATFQKSQSAFSSEIEELKRFNMLMQEELISLKRLLEFNN